VDQLLDQLRKSFADSYRVEQELEGGGMSRLFLATDLALSRKVVIKILPPELTSHMMAARFKRESELTAHLQHPNILPIITAGLKDGLLYYVMPFISGESLRQRLKRDHQLPVPDAVTILCEVASALAYAHKQGVIHRDIKPENILLQDGHAVLADFGIAAALAVPGEEPHSRITRTGMSVGTVGYMAPEQALGGTDVDSRADIYSLGVVSHEMLAGSPPFKGATTQAILAAHLTQQPPRLDDFRDDVPVPVSRAIEKALKKDPAERFQTASEFASACGQRAPRRSTLSRVVSVRKLRRIPRRTIAAGAFLVLLVAAASWYALHRAPQPAQESVTVAIAPFDAPTSDLKLWHEGIVDLLARNIDGAGPLRTVSPTLAIRSWKPGTRSEQNPARQLGQLTKAQYAIYGSLVPSVADSVRMHFGLVDVKTDTVLVEEDLSDASVEKLAGQLTVKVLDALRGRHRLGAVRATSTIGSDSALALKAFLQGEQYYRKTFWDSASVAYAHAISIDSGFALALRRAGQVTAWQKSETDSATRAFALRAGSRNHRLAPRDSLLIAADSLSSALEGGDPNLPNWRIARRLFATVNAAAARYPDDPEVWYVVGEARFHHGYGSIFDISEAEVRDAFKRSIALDSAFSPAYIHLVELGYTLDGAEAGRAAAREYLARNPGGQHAAGIQLLNVVTDPGSRNQTARLLAGTPSDVLFDGWMIVRRWPDSAETALQLLRAVARKPRSSSSFAEDSARLQNYLPLQLAYRGRFRESYLALGNRPSRLFAQLALLGAIEPDTARAVFARWLIARTPQVHTALPWWVARGDSTSIMTLIRSYDSATAAAKPEGKGVAHYNSEAARAYLLLARHDSAAALNAFAALSDTLCLRCDLDRLTTAKLLANANRFAEADKILRQRLFSAVNPTEIVMAAERGRIADALGHKQDALRSYQLVVRAWSRGDPEAQPLVREAQQRIARLNGG
jgi:eukaryotic-like serine/threonine-protein kinase